MKIEEALKDGGRATRKGFDWFVEECQNGEHIYRAIHIASGGVVGYEMAIRHFFADDWQPYHEVKEIRPEKAGELWEGASNKVYVTVYRKGILCFHDLEKRESTGYLDFKRNDNSAWVCCDEPIHNKNGWERILPKVEDDSVEIIEIEKVTFGRIQGANGAKYVSIISTSCDSPGLETFVNKTMKVTFEIPKDKP